MFFYLPQTAILISHRLNSSKSISSLSTSSLYSSNSLVSSIYQTSTFTNKDVTGTLCLSLKAKKVISINSLPEIYISLICDRLNIEDLLSLTITTKRYRKFYESKFITKVSEYSIFIQSNILPLFIGAISHLEIENRIIPSAFSQKRVKFNRGKKIAQVLKLPQPKQMQNLCILTAQYYMEDICSIRSSFKSNLFLEHELSIQPDFKSKCKILERYINAGALGNNNIAPSYLCSIICSTGINTNQRYLYLNLIQHFIDMKANVNGLVCDEKGIANPDWDQCYEESEVITACMNKPTERLDILKILMRNGANPNRQDADGMTPLHGLESIIRFTPSKADLIFLQLKPVLEVLFQYNIDPFIRNSEGETARESVLKWRDRQSPKNETIRSIAEYLESYENSYLSRNVQVYMRHLIASFQNEKVSLITFSYLH